MNTSIMDKINNIIAEIETLQSEIKLGKRQSCLALLPCIKLAATTMRYTETKDGSNREYENFLRKMEYLLELGQSHGGTQSSTSRKKESNILKNQNSIKYGSFELDFEAFNACLETLNKRAETTLHLAVKECQCAEYSEVEYKYTIDSVVIFILLNRAILNAKDRDGQTALMMAAKNGCLHIVKVLADWEDEYDGETVDLNAEDIYGETALFKAVLFSRVEVVEFLVQRGALDICDNRGLSALHAAVCGPCESVEKSVVSDFLGDFDWMTYMKHPFHLSTGRSRTENAFRKLESITGNRENTAKIIDVLLQKFPESLTVEDFRGNTVLDWAVRSKTRISELTINKLKQCIRTKTPTNPEELLNVDEWGRTSFHRLSADWPFFLHHQSEILDTLIDVMHRASNLNEIHFEPFKTMACRKDKKGRTALHYDVISKTGSDAIETIIKLGCSVNETDGYGRTPLHYAKTGSCELLLKKHGADETIKDCDEKTPLDLIKLRQEEECVSENAYGVLYFDDDDDDAHNGISNNECKSGDGLSSQFNTVTSSRDKSKFKKVDTWKIWTTRKYAYRDPFSEILLKQVNRFFDRLAEEITKMDLRFECRSVLVGSAYEGTRIGFLDEFDFNLVLTKFGECCEISPAPEAPVGFVRLHRKSNLTGNRTAEGHSQKKLDFDRFFSNNGILMSNIVASLFRCLYYQVMEQPRFWNSEPFFEWDSRSEDDGIDVERYESQDDLKASKNLCTNIILRLNRPINGQYMFREISVDIVPCIRLDGWWPDGTLSTVSNELRAEGCSLVFDQPQKKYPWTPVSADPYVRISFAEAESRIIKDSSVVAKAAYMVVKQMLSLKGKKYTHVWKSSLLYCIEALNDERNKDMNYEDIRREDLRSFVEKMTLCFFEFYLLDFCPCYIMPSFSLPIDFEMKYNHSERSNYYYKDCKWAYKLYYSVCEGIPETLFREPVRQPLSEKFDRDELMRKLSKIPNYPEYIVV